MSKRLTYLDDIKTQLKTIPRFVGVWNQRTLPVRNSFPCITFYSDNEVMDTQGLNNQEEIRTLSLNIHCWLQGTLDFEKIERDMDDCIELVDNCLVKLTDTMANIKPVSIAFSVTDTEPLLHMVAMIYEVQYCVDKRNLLTFI